MEDNIEETNIPATRNYISRQSTGNGFNIFFLFFFYVFSLDPIQTMRELTSERFNMSGHTNEINCGTKIYNLSAFNIVRLSVSQERCCLVLFDY